MQDSFNDIFIYPWFSIHLHWLCIMYHAHDHCSCNLSKLEVAICGLKRLRLQVEHTIKRPGGQWILLTLPFLKEKDLSVINHLNCFPNLRHLLPNCRHPLVLSDSLSLLPPDNLRHLAAIQTGMKGFSASFPAVCTQKGTPLRLILKRSAFNVFGTGTYALLYTVICYDVPLFDFLLHMSSACA